MIWRPSERIVRPFVLANPNLRAVLQSQLVWPDSNLNGGADYSVDFSEILGPNEAVLSFDFDPGTSGSIAWVSSYGSCVTAYISWLVAGSITISVGVLSSLGNTYQVAISINVSGIPALIPPVPQPGPGPIAPFIDSGGMEGWFACLGTEQPSGDRWWNNAGVPTFSGQPDFSDASIPGLIITDAGMSAWLVSLPVSAPVQGWWNNGGVLSFVGNPSRRQSQINSAQMAAWLASLPTVMPPTGWWNNANIPTLKGSSQ